MGLVMILLGSRFILFLKEWSGLVFFFWLLGFLFLRKIAIFSERTLLWRAPHALSLYLFISEYQRHLVTSVMGILLVQPVTNFLTNFTKLRIYLSQSLTHAIQYAEQGDRESKWYFICSEMSTNSDVTVLALQEAEILIMAIIEQHHPRIMLIYPMVNALVRIHIFQVLFRVRRWYKVILHLQWNTILDVIVLS